MRIAPDARQIGGVHRHPVRLDVIGVAVPAEVVIGEQHLRTHLPDDAHQVIGRLTQIGLPEGPGVLIGGSAHHAGVPISPRPAEEPLVHGSLACGQLAQGTLKLADAVPPQRVGVLGEVLQ